MSVPSTTGYQNQKCHSEHHSARNYVYFGVRFPGTPPTPLSLIVSVLYNTIHFSSLLSRSLERIRI